MDQEAKDKEDRQIRGRMKRQGLVCHRCGGTARVEHLNDDAHFEGDYSVCGACGYERVMRVKKQP